MGRQPRTTHQTVAATPADSGTARPAGLGFEELYPVRQQRRTESPSIPFAFPGIVENTVTLRCVTTTIDDHGRISDRSTLKALEWAPGQAVSFDGDHRTVAVHRTRQSHWTIGRTGYLRIPAANRNVCGLAPADRILIAADPVRDMLVVLPIPVVAAALQTYLPDLWQPAA